MFLLAISALTAVLNWTDNSTNETGFNVYRQLVGGTMVFLSTAPPDATTFTDNDSHEAACYQVTAFNSVGESSPSNVACKGSKPLVPGALTVK